jgi:hypothetical protein
MGAPKYTDRILAQEVRSLTLKKIKDVLQPEYQDKEFQKAVILRLAGSVLPRLREDFEEPQMPIPLLYVSEAIAEKNGLKYGSN